MAYEIQIAGYKISGPVKGDHELHPSFTVYNDSGVLASFYAFDGDQTAAERRARTYCAAEEARKALQSIEKGDAVVFDDELQRDVEVAMDMEQAQSLAAHALQQF